MNEAKIASFREALVCESAAMQAVADDLVRALRVGSNVLLVGERGTGKNKIGEGLHALSGRVGQFIRKSGPTLRGDEGRDACVGHIKGAFTGATCDRAGAFELALRGTLFIDQIGHLDIETQAVLLTALDPGWITRLGEPGRTRDVSDVQLVAAATRDLDQMVQRGEFLADLLDRLGKRIRVPSLRERRPDIPELARRLGLKHGVEVPEHILPALVAHDWPGNVRGLHDFIRSCRPEGVVTPELIERQLGQSLAPPAPPPPPTTRERILAAIEALGEASRADLEEETGLPASTIKYHLARAGEVTMVNGYEAGRRNVRYRVDTERPSERPTTGQLTGDLSGDLSGGEGAS